MWRDHEFLTRKDGNEHQFHAPRNGKMENISLTTSFLDVNTITALTLWQSRGMIPTGRRRPACVTAI